MHSNLNLNLLPVLSVLLETRSVTRSAERLGLTQPAVSHALSKLRQAFDDELLIMVGRELKLTPMARKLQEPLQDILANVDTLDQLKNVDPENWQGEVVIATADQICNSLLAPLLKKVSQVAPALTIRFTNLTRRSLKQLELDKIDLMIAPEGLIQNASLIRRSLFSDHFVCIYSAKTDLKPPVDLEGYLDRTHIVSTIDYANDSPITGVIPELDELRAKQNNIAVIPYYLAIPLIVANTEYVSLIQKTLVEKFIEYGEIEYCDPPIEIPPIELSLFWHPRRNSDPAHLWLRNEVVSIFAKHSRKSK
ncbi:LysR family transcriptional regulator [Parasphingopyxis sp.]|uniref:LysR family transcriptional regulator n=1 Tax=Parasphingopyxis sp. TaxID=1920299 RepID=UPI002632F5F6|nr:LysR family transcriptional regulator [Parasphingopyxis sp.]